LRRKLVIGFVAMLLLATTITAFAVTLYWTSTIVTKHIELHVEGIDGLIIDTDAFANYGLKTVPTSMNGFGDVRDDSFLVAVADINIDGDMSLSIEATGIPEGMVITAKMAWALYYKDLAGTSGYIQLFNDAGTKQQAYKGNTDEWFNVVFTTMRTVEVNGAPTTILSTEIPRVTYNATRKLDATGIIPANCNGLWLRFNFDTSAITEMGDYVYDIGITVSLGEA